MLWIVLAMALSTRSVSYTHLDVYKRQDLHRDHLRRQVMDGGHALRVLRGDGGDDVHAISAEGGPRLEVGLQTSRAAGVGAGDGEEGEGMRQSACPDRRDR